VGLNLWKETQAHHRTGILELVSMMELYQTNPKDFLKLFPKEVLGSTTKEGGYATAKSFFALRDYHYIQYNSKDRINIIAVDIDHHQDGSVWLDHDLPQPTWTIWTDRGVQLMWVLAVPILLHTQYTRANKQYAKDVLDKIVYALGADTNAIGFNRVFRNPLKHDSRYSDSRVSLKDFKHLETPSRDWFERVYPTRVKHETLFGGHRDSGLDFTDMEEGDGRNVALFDRLRYWAYDVAKAGKYTEFDLAHKGYVLNQAFKQELESKEVDRIITSIDRFIEHTYMRSSYMANTTKEERSKIAKKNGKKGGAVKKKQAHIKIEATIIQMQSFDIKITVADLARRAKSAPKVVRAYLNQKSWKEASRKEGWKHETNS
jgi:hypothetical protein